MPINLICCGFKYQFPIIIQIDDNSIKIVEIPSYCNKAIVKKAIIDKTKPIYVICQSGLRSYIACRILASEGFDCYNFSGGYRLYENITKEINLIENRTSCGMHKWNFVTEDNKEVYLLSLWLSL